MAGRKKSDTSVSTIVGLMLLGESVNIQEKTAASVAVMVSLLRKNEPHKDKKFKIKSSDNGVTVTRVL